MARAPELAVDDLPVVHRLAELPAAMSAETITTLAAGHGFRFDHIRSGEHASPPGFWFEQSESEWAIVLSGAAELEFEAGRLALKAGDAVLIPAGLRHRVAHSAPDTVWLALHFASAGGPESLPVPGSGLD